VESDPPVELDRVLFAEESPRVPAARAQEVKIQVDIVCLTGKRYKDSRAHYMHRHATQTHHPEMVPKQGGGYARMVRNARGDVTAMEPMVKIPGSSNTNLKNAVAARAGFKGAGFDKWRARWDLNPRPQT
jgi:hypothetical protein